MNKAPIPEGMAATQTPSGNCCGSCAPGERCDRNMPLPTSVKPPAPPSFGQAMVRQMFNPSGYDAVACTKELAARCIDDMHGLRTDNSLKMAASGAVASPEVARLASLAITHYETAVMFAVKARTAGATAPDPAAPMFTQEDMAARYMDGRADGAADALQKARK